jgi:uncharacterized membrane protein
MSSEVQTLHPESTSTGSQLLRLLLAAMRILLGAALIFAGIAHLTFARVEFLAQVPPWLPLNGDLVVVLSGIVEILLGVGLIFARKQRALVGLATAIFFVLIFPGNISQYLNGIDAFGLDSDRARLIRLFFQPVLVIWALVATGGWRLLMPNRRTQ